MEDLKIRVNSEAESKEAQELFFELGYQWAYKNIGKNIFYEKENIFLYADKGGNLGTGTKENKTHFNGWFGTFVSLPELRDLVVLKRNKVGDATHTDGRYSFYVGKDKNYFFSSCDKAWRGTWKNVEILKPIEKKEMKEYLRKNSNGTYSYIGPVHTDHVHDFMIEIPEGAIKLVYSTTNNNHYHFVNNKNQLMSLDDINNNDGYWYGDAEEYISSLLPSVVWSRHTTPEELPFIDDEPSINDQYAEIEKVRQSHRTASEIADSALKYIRERAETYDQPTGERSAVKTAKAFNAITGKDITESEVWLLLQLLKDVRQWSREDYHQDSAEDCIAYAALKAESLEGGE